MKTIHDDVEALKADDWTDPVSKWALRAVGCDCQLHGYVNIHDMCKDEARKVREAIRPLVESHGELLDALKKLREATIVAYKHGRIEALSFVNAGLVVAKAESL